MNEEVLIQGNAAIAESAIRAGCRYYFGYPITPSSEIAEYFAARAGQNGITYLQAETEIAAFNMVAGVAAAGRIAMTATSGPGFCLGVETISFMASAQLPAVIVDCMRPGPGDGEILAAQGDYFQLTKGGGAWRLPDDCAGTILCAGTGRLYTGSVSTGLPLSQSRGAGE